MQKLSFDEFYERVKNGTLRAGIVEGEGYIIGSDGRGVKIRELSTGETHGHSWIKLQQDWSNLRHDGIIFYYGELGELYVRNTTNLL